MEEKVKKVQKPVMTGEEFQEVRDQAEAAKELLEDERFTFFREYLRNEKEVIVSDFVNNKIRKTKVTEKGELKDVEMTYSKEEQENEMSGKFKFIFELISKLQWYVQIYEDALKAQEKGSLVIEGDPEK